ncbi:MAG: TonB-dependent receptor plug domain-containing protein [Smithellaceae bacterium]|jgi:iron complex outermembrane receptor protein
MHRFIFNVILVLFFIFFSIPVIAAEEKDAKQEEAVKMPEVVVVASPIIQGNQVNDSGSQVTIVQQKQISDLNAQDLPSALRMTPGVDISRYNQVGSFGGADGGAIYIRGMGSSRPGAEIQMLVDGIPKFAGVWTHPLMDIMNVDIADSIEVYKGAQPILFGNMSMGAVNIITKRQKDDGFSTNLMAAGGSYNTFVETLEHGGKINDLDYYLVQSFKQSSGHRENADGELQDYFARVGYKLNDLWSIAMTANATHNFADDPGPLGMPQDRQGTFKTEDNMSIITLSHNYDKIKGYLKMYWDNGKMSWLDEYDLVHLYHYNTITWFDNYGIRDREIVNLWPGGTITGGVDFDFSSGTVDTNNPAPIPSSTFPRETFRILSPYVALSQEFEIINSWKLIPSVGIRYYNHSDFDQRFSPQAGLVLRDASTDLHVFYSKGINYPGLYVAAIEGGTSWRDLNPETVDHLEAGIAHSFGSKIRADITLFHDKGSDRIIMIFTPAPTFTNISNFETQGVEATLNFHPLPNLSLFTGGTWLYERSPDNLPYAPQWTASAGGNLKLFNHLTISLDTSYQDWQYVANTRTLDYGGSFVRVDGFWLLNGKISWEFKLPSPKISGDVFLAGENLTNVSYAYQQGYPMPGINCMLGANLKF